MPTSLVSPFLTRGRAEIILLHPYERKYDLPESSGFEFLKYRPWNTLAKSESEASISHHNCLAISVVLKSPRLRKPNPPSFLLRQIFCQAIQCKPLFWFPELHQNHATALVSLPMIHFGSLKQDIT